jgi:competence protein ComEC
MPHEKQRFSAILLILLLVALTGYSVREVFDGRPARQPVYHQLDVGQGDAEVIELPGGALIMTDAGPDSSVLNSFERALPGAKHIDLAIVSHPQLDHFNGYNFLIDHYRIGAFVINGRDDGPNVREWPELLAKIHTKKIPLLTLKAGDRITYGKNSVAMLSPDSQFIQSGELNDTGFVEYVSTTEWTALLTADTGTNIEDVVFATSAPAIDILKVGHHGSKYSTGNHFLAAIHPRVAVVSSGLKNRYGHPAPSTIARLAAFHIPVFRTDQKGSITVWREGSALKVKMEK